MDFQRLGRWVLEFGIDPRRLGNIKRIPRYLADRRRWRSRGGDITSTFPIVSDYRDNAGIASGHYFHQDLLVASLIYSNAPQRHVDIGSRIDGFVAHVAAFRRIEVVDIRPISLGAHQNISFVQADVMQPFNLGGVDSVSCLHALEHFGLGRYGDSIDPEGHLKGFANIVNLLKSGGDLYISFPIGRIDEVHYNAHRVFNPRSIFEWEPTKACLDLVRFDYVDDFGDLHTEADVSSAGDLSYGCGIYTFRKR